MSNIEEVMSGLFKEDKKSVEKRRVCGVKMVQSGKQEIIWKRQKIEITKKVLKWRKIIFGSKIISHEHTALTLEMAKTFKSLKWH